MQTNPYAQYANPYAVYGTPKRPAPQTQSQEEIDRLRAADLGYDVQDAPVDNARNRVGLRRDQVGLESDTIGVELKRRELDQKDRDARGSQIDRETGLRNTFAKLPQVQDYTTVLPLFASALRADDTKAGDLNIIYSFGKIMDPGSVVREGEMVMVQGTGQVQDRLRGLMAEVDGRGRLGPQTRQALLNEVRQRASAIADAYNQQREYYKGLAQQYGVPELNIVGPHPGAPFQRAEADFLGRPIRNLDGSQGAGPTQQQSELIDLSPEQRSAYQAFWAANPNPTPEQLTGFLASIGIQAGNAAEIIQAAKEGRGISLSRTNPEFEQLKAVSGEGDLTDLVQQGMTLGLSDQAAGVGNAAANILTSPFTGDFDPIGAYQVGRDVELAKLEEARQRLGWGGTAAELGGAILSGNVGNAFRVAPTLLGRIGQGAKAGAAGGGVAGYGYGEGLEGSLAGAGAGAVGGAALGAALPVAGAVVSNRAQAVRRMTGRDPELPRRLVGEAMEADGNAPAAAGRMMDEAHGRGSPMMLADTGDNARELLASVGRQPGPSHRIARESVTERQLAQGERISAAVVRDLGPTANLREMGEELIERAKESAKPIYDKFYSSPGASSVKLNDLLARPSIQRALSRAHRIAAEEGIDPTALGFTLNDAGEVSLTRVPSFQTLDYVKRGLDDVIEGYRDKTTGKLVLDTEGRAINATLRSLLARIDKVAPVYAEARSAYAGPAKMRDAMDKGAKALSKSPDDIVAMMKGMGEAEKESFRLGVRKAITDLIASKRDGGDKVAALIGTPKSRAALMRVFGNKKEFDRFIATLRDEETMGRTYRAVTGNSSTAGRQAFDQQTNDAGLAESALDAAMRGGKDGMFSALVAGLQKLRDIDKFGAGQAGQRTRESIAALLSETDPRVLRELIIAAQRASKMAKVKIGRQSRNAVNVGRNAGNVSGMAFGNALAGPRD